MSIRLRIFFNGSPEDEVQTLREVVEVKREDVSLPRLVHWRAHTKKDNIWTLDVDALPLDRSKVVFVLATTYATKSDVDTICAELTALSNVVLGLFGEEMKDNKERRKKMRLDCVDMCDRVFVVNTDNDIDDDTAEILEYAQRNQKHIVYLNY